MLITRAATAVIFTIVLLLGGCSNPGTLTPTAAAVRTPGERQILLPAPDGRAVEVWSAATPAARSGARAYVLHFCDGTERAESALPAELNRWDGYAVEIWAVNYPGFGASTGPADLRQIPAAALLAYDAVRHRAGRAPVFVSGFSLGAATGLCVGARRPVAGLLLRDAPPLKDIINTQAGWWNMGLLPDALREQVPPELDSRDNARRCSAPAVFVISGADRVVPRPYQRGVTGAYAGEKRVVVDESAAHGDPLAPAAQKKFDTDLRWLWSRAKPR